MTLTKTVFWIEAVLSLSPPLSCLQSLSLSLVLSSLSLYQFLIQNDKWGSLYGLSCSSVVRSNLDQFSEVCTDYMNTKIYPLFDMALVFQDLACRCQTSSNKTECTTNMCKIHTVIESLSIHYVKLCVQLLYSHCWNQIITELPKRV